MAHRDLLDCGIRGYFPFEGRVIDLVSVMDGRGRILMVDIMNPNWVRVEAATLHEYFIAELGL